ncbi:transglycosylase domain-containing protein, partial [Salmonella enterica subsp. enterica serovar Kentucky]|nr:transglycosylase domain-containing protein [Salmonella enterica subsp. enterica serovar Kentucky]
LRTGERRFQMFKYLSSGRKVRRIENFLRFLCGYRHFDAMMLAQAYYGRDSQGNAVYGTKNAALTLFHVPVTEMTCQQQVQLIYMFKAPSLYRPGSARLVESSKHYMTLCQEQIQQ